MYIVHVLSLLAMHKLGRYFIKRDAIQTFTVVRGTDVAIISYNKLHYTVYSLYCISF